MNKHYLHYMRALKRLIRESDLGRITFRFFSTSMMRDHWRPQYETLMACEWDDIKALAPIARQAFAQV